MKSVLEFDRAARELTPIVVVAAYDALMARLLAASEADAILVGDSVAMVVHGYPSTVHATVEMMALHVAAVRRGAPELLVIADMPFLSVRQGTRRAIAAAGALIQAGANAVKVEGLAGHEKTISRLVESGIPVMGHLGLTPQAIHRFGGHRVQGRTDEDAEKIRADARALEARGAFSIVLECIPSALAGTITRELTIPTVGIGAGPETSGQVLVLPDLLGLDARFRPRFARRYLDGHAAALAAVNAFARDVREARFPAPEEVPA